MAGPGSWLLHAAGPRSRDLPGFVLVGNGNEHPGPGFLDPKVTPVPVADPESGLENTDRPAYLSQQNFERRLALADRIDRDFRQRYAGPQIAAYDQLYKDAVRLLGSVDLEAFDIAREKEKTREQYGLSRIGQGCLLARRLVEAGVRCVEVEFGNWDMHRDLFDDMPEHAGQLDAALGGLLEDLDSRGLLDTTLVVLATEFGRSPGIMDSPANGTSARGSPADERLVSRVFRVSVSRPRKALSRMAGYPPPEWRVSRLGADRLPSRPSRALMPHVRHHSELVDVDHGQVVYPSLEDVALVMRLDELAPVGGRAAGRRDWISRARPTWT